MNEKWKSISSHLYLANLLVGIFLVANVPFFFGNFQLQNITYPYRLISVVLCLWVVFCNYRKKLPSYAWLLLVFFIVYALRMIYDTQILQNSYKKEAYQYFATYFGACVIPAISVFYIDFKKIKLEPIFRTVYIAYFIFCLLNVVFYKVPGAEIIRSSGITQLWAIGFGQAGVTLAIFSVILYPQQRTFRHRWVYILGFFLGCFVMIISASKGPFITLVFLVALYFILYRTFSFFSNPIFIGIAIIFLIYFFQFTGFFSRFSLSFFSQDPSTIERVHILQTTVEKIRSNIFLGDAFLLSDQILDSTYPHNLFLEAFMALGILGFLLFLIINYYGISALFLLIKEQKYLWLCLMFLQYFIQAFFSGSLYSSTFYWVLISIIINIYVQKKNIIKFAA